MTIRIKRFSILSRAAYACGLALLAGASEPKADDPLQDFYALEEKMADAYDEYVTAVRERMQRQAAGKSDDAGTPDEPPDRRVDILHKMDALADRSADHPAAGKLAIKTFLWSAGFRLDTDHLLERLDRIPHHGVNEPELAEALDMVPDVYHHCGKPHQWVQRLKRMADATTNKEVRLVARFALGRIHLESDNLGPAGEALGAVVEADPKSEYARLARGFLHEIQHLQPGMPAPDFTATTLSGETISLKSLRGKVVLLDFWATWCAPCLAEFPHLKAAAAKFADRPFVIVSVSLDDFREMLEATVQQRELPGIQVWDESGRDHPAAELYNAENLPTWYLIDREGIIRGRDPFGEALIPAVEALLSSSDDEP